MHLLDSDRFDLRDWNLVPLCLLDLGLVECEVHVDRDQRRGPQRDLMELLEAEGPREVNPLARGGLVMLVASEQQGAEGGS